MDWKWSIRLLHWLWGINIESESKIGERWGDLKGNRKHQVPRWIPKTF